MNLSPPVWPLARTSEQPQSRCTDKACICKQLAFVRKVMVWARAPGEPLPARVAPARRQGPHGRGEVHLALSPIPSLFSQMQVAYIYTPCPYTDSEAAQRS